MPRRIIMISMILSSAVFAGEGVVYDISAMFNSGGVLMWLMLATSVIGLAFAMERFFALRNCVHIPKELRAHVLWLIEREGVSETVAYLEGRRSTYARVLRVIISRWGFTREEIERAVDDELARALWDERRNIKTVGIVATIAPLMGLLGTVIGMIDAFRQAAEKGMDNPAIFAGGIYQALYTTAFGLMISIPFVIVYNVLRSRAEQIMRRVEDEALDFVAEIDAGWDEPQQDAA